MRRSYGPRLGEGMRVVYSFSVGDNSVAHWQLKKWKAEGRVISHLLEKLIEGDGSAILELEARIQALEWKTKRQNRILNYINVTHPGWEMPDNWEEVVDRVDA